jgi:lysozyme family protein
MVPEGVHWGAMSAKFDAAIRVVLRHEGGWVSDPADLGGETNFGISTLIIQREKLSPEFLGLDPKTAFKPGWLKPLTSTAATKVYWLLFWNKYQYDLIDNVDVATKIFDCGVNCGPSRAHVMAQKAANACGQVIKIDGLLGKDTVKAINAVPGPEFMAAMKTQMQNYYLSIIASRPANAKFKNNWMSRAAWGV